MRRLLGPIAAFGLLLAAMPLAAQPQLQVTAIAGQPWGVGRLVVELAPQDLPEPLGADGLRLTEKDGRVFYPAIRASLLGPAIKNLLEGDTPLTTGGPVRQEVGGVLRGLLDRPGRTTIYFLFRGQQPLDLTLQAKTPHSVQVAAVNNPRAYQRLLAEWWRQYVGRPRLFQTADYPPIIENYLTATLARRLNLRLPPERQTASAEARFNASAMIDTESLDQALLQDRALGLTPLGMKADQPLPKPVEWPALELPEPAAGVQVEPIAMHVPTEYIYVRFGSYANFLWMQDTLARWGGDLQNLVASRGLDYGHDARMQDQLVLKETQLSRMLGGTVISDVAIIATDMSSGGGSAVGFLFEARNDMILGADLASQRADRVKQGGVQEQKLKLAGEEVSLLSSADGSVRSYYASHGGYHFVTSSKTMATRFLEVSKGGQSLGASKEFRHARTLVPLGRNDAVFAYLSDAFFRNIASAQYRVETMRQLQATADIELVLMAKLNAATEGKPAGTIGELISGGMLPTDFGPRPDGSRAVLERGEVFDQLRGRRGLFVPVPDVPVAAVTQAEAKTYGEFAKDAFRLHRNEPVIAAIAREEMPGNRERVTVEVRMTPLDQKRFPGFWQVIGAADTKRLVPVPGDMAAAGLVLAKGRAFGGLRDVASPAQILNGPAGLWDKIRNTLIGYAGYTGDPGILGLLLFNGPIASPPDAEGYSGGPLGLWRRKIGEFTVYSFQRDVLQTVTPQLRFEQAKRPAQLRLRVLDVSQSRITSALNRWGYQRTRETVLGNLRLLHVVSQQLHVPTESCRDAAELILGAKLICPLGGKLILAKQPDGSVAWTSTALADRGQSVGAIPEPPSGYVAPPLSWFRGLDLEAMLDQRTLSVRAEVLMQLPAAKP